MRLDFLNRRFAISFLASVASGGLLVLTYPCFDRAEFAWVALIPLTLLVLHRSPKESFVWSYVSGATFFIGSLYWLMHVTVAGWIVLSLFLALYVAAWGTLISKLASRLGGTTRMGRNLLLAMLASCAWVGTEIVRTHLFTGFPWNFLGVSQYRKLPLIQFASVTGVYGVSWLVCFVNVCLAITLLRLKGEFSASRSGRQVYRPHVEMMAALGLVLLAVVLGFRAANVQQAREGKATAFLNVAVVQPNIPQDEKWDGKFQQMIYTRLERLTEAALRTKPDLIIWPETATPEPLEYDPAAMRIITNAVVRSGAYLLTGSMTVARDVPRTKSDPSNPGRVWYNSAFLITPQGQLIEPYHKQHLVPFGEFIPLAKIFPWMKYTTPIPGSFGRGKQRTLFQIRPSTLDSRPSTFGTPKLAVVICFEDVFPDLFRRFVKQGANLMVNITNDAWYKESAGAYQHMANSVFRAVENRVPLVRCANTGYSCFIDSTGRIRAHIAGNEKERIFVQGFRTEKVAPRNPSDPLTFYARCGDIFAWSCFGVGIAALGWSFRVNRDA